MDHLPSGVMLSPPVILPLFKFECGSDNLASDKCFGLVYICQRVLEGNRTVGRDGEVLNIVTCSIHGMSYCGPYMMKKLETGITAG